jgi:hypothetical protein
MSREALGRTGSHTDASENRAATWDEYEERRAAWLSRLMFGWMLPEPMPAGPPPEPPEDGRDD